MPFLVSEAKLADVPAITAIFRNDEPAPFMRLCLGSVHSSALSVKQADNITDEMHEDDQLWLVARDSESGKTASFAQWRLPKEEADSHEEQDAAELVCFSIDCNKDRSNDMAQEAERELLREAITPGMNADLVLEFRDQITRLRKAALKGQRHFSMSQLMTPLEGADTIQCL